MLKQILLILLVLVTLCLWIAPGQAISAGGCTGITSPSNVTASQSFTVNVTERPNSWIVLNIEQGGYGKYRASLNGKTDSNGRVSFTVGPLAEGGYYFTNEVYELNPDGTKGKFVTACNVGPLTTVTKTPTSTGGCTIDNPPSAGKTTFQVSLKGNPDSVYFLRAYDGSFYSRGTAQSTDSNGNTTFTLGPFADGSYLFEAVKYSTKPDGTLDQQIGPWCKTTSPTVLNNNTANDKKYSCRISGGQGSCNEDTYGRYLDVSACRSVCNDQPIKATPRNPIYLCLFASCPTALGDIATDPGGFIAFFLRLALMFAGLAIILVLIVIGYRVLTSQGDPEQLQSAKELATSLFAGVLLIIFSLVLLQAIGVDILGLPGFSR